MTLDGFGNYESGLTSFLMIGQSNMAGRGDFEDVSPIRNDNCYMLRLGRWQRMAEPINPDRAVFEGEFHSGISLAASFADCFAKHFEKKVGLIPCADGGTRIEQWMPGQILFDHAVFMAKLAMRTSTLGGILWHQGESDCTDERVAVYKEKALHMIAELRRQLGAGELPFIFGEISEEITPRWKLSDHPRRMNAIFREMANEIPHSALVSAKGLTLKADGIHFDARSQREFGNRYFDAYLQVTRGEK